MVSELVGRDEAAEPRAATSAATSAATRPDADELLRSLLTLPDGAVDAAVEASIRRDDELDEDARHRVTFDRLRALLRLEAGDARRIVAAYERAARRLGGDYLARLRETERAVVLNAFDFRQFLAFRALLPWLAEEPLPDADGLDAESVDGPARRGGVAPEEPALVAADAA